jgi:hypothetical protein
LALFNSIRVSRLWPGWNSETSPSDRRPVAIRLILTKSGSHSNSPNFQDVDPARSGRHGESCHVTESGFDAAIDGKERQRYS